MQLSPSLSLSLFLINIHIHMHGYIHLQNYRMLAQAHAIRTHHMALLHIYIHNRIAYRIVSHRVSYNLKC